MNRLAIYGVVAAVCLTLLGTLWLQNRSLSAANVQLTNEKAVLLANQSTLTSELALQNAKVEALRAEAARYAKAGDDAAAQVAESSAGAREVIKKDTRKGAEEMNRWFNEQF